MHVVNGFTDLNLR